jgi:DNA repair protein RadA/Sms
MGKCQGCGGWNSVVETRITREISQAKPVIDADGGIVLPITDISSEPQQKLTLGLGELNRVLGGGLVRRSVVLVAGDPGIGKSTLLMQALANLSARGLKTLYVSGEESAEQLRLRADRLGIISPDFLVLIENRLEPLVDKLEQVQPAVTVIDSIQSFACQDVESHPGSVSQVREVASRVIQRIKASSSSCLIVGHVTKEGAIAGPKMLEHMVDTVVYFEGDRGHPFRILRAVKNRFGPISEIGVFQMHEFGLEEVTNPSELFLSERPEAVSGSVVTGLMEGSRPILTEIQALVTGPVLGQGRRTCIGVESPRLALLLAVMEKRLGLNLGDHDVFVNAVGGIRATEPAADLAVFASLLSSVVDKPIRAGSLVIGEVGLSGEIRRVSRCADRINEAVRLGFRRILLPASDVSGLRSQADVSIVGLQRVTDLRDALFD